MVHWLLSTTRCKTFALIGRCLRRGVVILQRAVEILQRVVGWAVRLQRPAIHLTMTCRVLRRILPRTVREMSVYFTLSREWSPWNLTFLRHGVDHSGLYRVRLKTSPIAEIAISQNSMDILYYKITYDYS